MAARSSARYLAPIALAATITGTYLVVHSGLTASPARPSHVGRGRGPKGKGQYANTKFYVVQPGDNLTSIALKTGIGLTALEAQNPNLDPNSLHPGQRLRLRR